MARDTRHAAWHDKREFSVRLIQAGGAARDLITGFTDFLAAVDFVTEWLDREDPSCAGGQRLVIVQTENGVSAEVFSYPPSDEHDLSLDLVRKYGFDPAALRFRPNEHPKPRLDKLSNRIARPPEPSRPVPITPEVPPARAEPPATVAESPPPRPRPNAWTTRHGVFALLRLMWEDRPSRSCLVIAALSLWLTTTLADPTFLLPLLASGTALWFLQHRRPFPEPDPDDWL
jgi:hypothetical protein